MPEERWLSVVGFEGLYEVSDQGRVRSLDRELRGGEIRRGRMLACPIDRKGEGYRFVALCREGISKKTNVHVLVLEAFRGPRPSDAHEACHGNGRRDDPRLSNLRWDTKPSNWADKWKHGTATAGDQSGSSVLTSELVDWIRESTQSSVALAPILGVASSTVRAVRIGQNWRHHRSHAKDRAAAQLALDHLHATPIGQRAANNQSHPGVSHPPQGEDA